MYGSDHISFFSSWNENVSDKFVAKVNTLCLGNPPPKVVPFMRQCGKYSRTGETTGTVWRMRISRWLPKAANTHSECVILIAFLLQQW